MGHVGATGGRIIADNRGHQRCLVQQLNGEMATASPGQERHLHAFTQQRYEISARVGCSQMQISRLQRRALARMRAQLMGT